MKVYAHFSEKFYVDFIYQDKVISTNVVEPNSTTNAEDVHIVITDNGYTFKHWTLDPNLNGPAFDFSNPITSNLKLYAVTERAWTVTFHSQGGTPTPIQIVKDGTQAENPDQSPTKIGYTFSHWSTSPDGTEFDFNSAINSNTELYAIWAANTNTPYCIIYWQDNAEDDGYTIFERDQKNRDNR